MSRYLSLLAIAVILSMIFFFVWNRRNALRYAKKLRGHLQEIDEQYATFVGKRLNLGVLEEEHPEKLTEQISTEAWHAVLPIANVIALIVSSRVLDGPQLKYDSPVFRGSIAFLETMGSEELPITENTVDQLLKHFQTDIRADIEKRILDLKLGRAIDS